MIRLQTESRTKNKSNICLHCKQKVEQKYMFNLWLHCKQKEEQKYMFNLWLHCKQKVEQKISLINMVTLQTESRTKIYV